MLREQIIVCSPLYTQLKLNDLDFIYYYIRYPYNKIEGIRGTPCAVVVVTSDTHNKYCRGISVCSSSEFTFDAIHGFEIAAARALRANKHQEDKDFIINDHQLNPAVENVKLYLEKINTPFKMYQYDVVLTKKENNRIDTVGWIHSIVT